MHFDPVTGQKVGVGGRSADFESAVTEYPQLSEVRLFEDAHH
jgi:hypothetical protein